MTLSGERANWWVPWRKLGLVPESRFFVRGETEAASEQREEGIARHLRDWIDAADERQDTTLLVRKVAPHQADLGHGRRRLRHAGVCRSAWLGILDRDAGQPAAAAGPAAGAGVVGRATLLIFTIATGDADKALSTAAIETDFRIVRACFAATASITA